MKPIHKFNGGKGATLCHKCSVIISEGLTEDLYCEKCEQKQNLIDMMKDDEELGLYEETLEEVAERLYPNGCDGTDRSAEIYRRIFIEGAKWQKEQFTIEEQYVGHTIDELDKAYIKGFNEGSAYYIERMYSEEEVLKFTQTILMQYKFGNTDIEQMDLLRETFQLFKKK